ncbi:hypothetical protein SLA2020_220340 [Shorea laevis]
MGEIILVFVVAVLMGMSGVAKGQFAQTHFIHNGSKASAMFVLGDSSVDCGENTLFYPFLHENLSLLPCNGSDSTLLPSLLAEKMGLPDSAPFYSQNGSVDGLLKGLNYGSAKATIMNPGTPSYQSLNQQIRQVFETFQLLQLQLGQERAYNFIRSSIFYLSFGKDDYVELFLRNNSEIMVKYSGQQFAQILVDQMVTAMRDLYDADARKIVFLGILPLGCTPRTVWEWYNLTAGGNQNGCVEEINELVLEYNTMLEERIVGLNGELPEAQIVFCDVYQGIMEIMTNPRIYGFEDATSACCGLGLNGAMIGCLSIDMACPTASSHVWWDLYSPTRAVNSLLADSAWSSEPLPDICRPGTIHDLVYTSRLPLT